ncbi:MAG: hypothetical protein K6C35_10545 [Eubacterium sp.]|nr:hypothetical protein [Eubacterium sp.]
MRPNIILLSFIMAVSAFSFETGTGKTDSRCRVAQSPSDIYVRDTVIRDLKEEQEDKEREAEELRRQAEELYSQLLSKSKYIAEVSKNIEETKDEIEVLEAYVSAAEEEINDIE